MTVCTFSGKELKGFISILNSKLVSDDTNFEWQSEELLDFLIV